MEKSGDYEPILSERFTGLAALLVIVIGVIVLIGWYGKLMFLTRFSINEVPMAPSTAYIFIFMAAGLWFYHRQQKIPIIRNGAIASALIAICLSCLLVLTNLFEYYSNWEHAFITIPDTQLNMQLGHMSLVTAILFIISGFALLFVLSSRKMVKNFSIILTLIIFVFSFLLLLGYGFGTPFFYYGSFIPPAVLTVLSFLLISMGLIAASDKNIFLIKSIWNSSTSAKLLRVFLPTTIILFVLESFIIIRVIPLLNMNHAISVLLLSVITVVVVIVVISIISRSMGITLDSTLKDLKESKERFSKISENAPVLINSFDENGRCLFWNEQCRKTFGWTIDEINDHEVTMELFYPDPAVCKEVIHAITSDSDGNFREWHPVTKDGLILSIMWANFSLPNGQVFNMGYDVTERKQAEEALRKSEAKLNSLFTSLIEMIVIHELVHNETGEAIDYRIIDCNKVFTEVTGIRKEDAIGKLASKVYKADPPPYLEKYAEVAQGGEPCDFNTYYAPMDKHFLISVVSSQTGQFATITTDISDMMQIQEMMIEKNKEMENYLYVASHDLRTPLVNIQGFSQRLKKQSDSIKTLLADKTLEPEILEQLGNITDENIPKTLSFIINNIEKMDTLINGLLQLSRTGRVEMNIQKIDMNKLFAKIFHSLDFQINEARCKFEIDLLPDCYGDGPLLDQLFSNIISNALKYSDSDRVLKVTVDAKKNYDKVVYAIRDTGKGIAQKNLGKIWDVFYRIDPRSGKNGEGIGLSLVKRIVEKHKGRVWAESKENKGSVFFIELHNRSFTEI